MLMVETLTLTAQTNPAEEKQSLLKIMLFLLLLMLMAAGFALIVMEQTRFQTAA